MAPDDINLFQRYVMAVLYYSTGGENWTFCSSTDKNCGKTQVFRNKLPHLSNASECKWAGLKCNNAGLMVAIKL
eukprot:13468615-Ditylum_brightwellii.AAC.1